jgi:hypothetical protein
MSVDLHFRPLDHSTWVPDGRRNYKRCPFKASWAKNLSQLRYELEKLGAKSAVVEIDYAGGDLRLDGLPYANTKPNSPRVRLSFEAPDIGPQCFMCDTYPMWQENLRGIVMTLDRLRAIERYGATRGKQQYRGWAGLPAKATDGFQNREEARAFLMRASGLNGSATDDQLYREAARRAHPDKGGDAQMMAKVNAARKTLE